jgi:hypothetical protein
MGWVLFSAFGQTKSAPTAEVVGVCEDMVNAEDGVVVLGAVPLGELVVMVVWTVIVYISVRTTVVLFTDISVKAYAGMVDV